MGEQERADLEALNADPERIETHGGDRALRARSLCAIRNRYGMSRNPTTITPVPVK